MIRTEFTLSHRGRTPSTASVAQASRERRQGNALLREATAAHSTPNEKDSRHVTRALLLLLLAPGCTLDSGGLALPDASLPPHHHEVPMLRHTCSLLAALVLVACASDRPRSFAPTDAAVDSAVPLPDSGVVLTDADVDSGANTDGGQDVDSGTDTTPDADSGADADTGLNADSGTPVDGGTDAGPPTVCAYPDEIVDGTRCIGMTVDVDLTGWADVCSARGGHRLEWRTLAEQARLQTLLFPHFTGGMTGLGRSTDGSWTWMSDRSPALVTWSTPPMAGHTVASLGASGATGQFRDWLGRGFCVRDVP